MTSAVVRERAAALAPLLIALLSMFVLLLLLNENGVLIPAGAAEVLHEVTHDARHAFGVPCH